MTRLAVPISSKLIVSLCSLVLLFISTGCRMVHRTDSIEEVLGQASRTPKPIRLGTLTNVGLLDFQFQKPTSQSGMGLFATTPYDANRIPVVLVHGLGSDADAWNTMLKRLHQDPRIDSKFQFWKFSYSTGNSILKSASDLRLSLQDALNQLDPKRQNPHLKNTVLIGHSMGGLLSKLQVTHGDDQVWERAFGKAIDQLDLDPDARQAVQSQLHFDPQPMVSRVIYIGVPHRGSTWSDNAIERLTSRLLRFGITGKNDDPNPIADMASGLLVDSATGIQSNIDQLSWRSEIIKAIADLPTPGNVEVHSIIGKGILLPDGSQGDGLVSVESARINDSSSELYVAAKHTDLTNADESIEEVQRILIEHLATQPPTWAVTADR